MGGMAMLDPTVPERHTRRSGHGRVHRPFDERRAEPLVRIGVVPQKQRQREKGHAQGSMGSLHERLEGRVCFGFGSLAAHLKKKASAAREFKVAVAALPAAAGQDKARQSPTFPQPEERRHLLRAAGVLHRAHEGRGQTPRSNTALRGRRESL